MLGPCVSAPEVGDVVGVVDVIVDGNVDVIDVGADIDVVVDIVDVDFEVDVVLEVVDVDVDVDTIVVLDPATHIVKRFDGAAPINVSFVGDWQVLWFSVPPQHFQEPSELSYTTSGKPVSAECTQNSQ
ncbi:MAG TPA: hypothetical protein VHV83_16490 [Armatimonadota bacterium]|nr:hypothetical protein [Armatimonadota bacterium]